MNARSKLWLGTALILLAVGAAYSPILNAGFIWDDDAYVTNEPLIRAADGLYRFWFTTEGLDYYPLTSTTWWLEWRLWGMNATGYHVTNVLLHGLAAVFLWRVLKRLQIPGAWFAALLFAVHPVNVESVAWIAERKNVLAFLWYVVALLFYLRFEENQARRWYWGAWFAFLLGLLSKPAIVMLPVVLLGCAWWQRERIERRDLLRSVPFFATAAVLSAVTIWFQYKHAVGHVPVQLESWPVRIAGAGWAVGFYLYKAIVPVDLTFVYPRWTIDASSWVSYLPGLVEACCFLIFWRYRRTWGKPLLFALGYFVLMLFPVLGFFKIYYLRYSLVADHWQYVSLIGIIALLVGWGTALSERIASLRHGLLILAAAVGVAFIALTWHQTQIYRNEETLWRDTLAKNPSAWIAHGNLGAILFRQGKTQEAFDHFQTVLRLKPDDEVANNYLGRIAAAGERWDEAIALYQKALQAKPDYAEAHYNLGVALAAEGKHEEALAQYVEAVKYDSRQADAQFKLANELLQKGEIDGAISCYREAIEAKPDFIEAQFNLASALVRKGELDEAAACFTTALRMKPDFVDARYNFGNLLLRQGKPGEAIEQYREVIRLRSNHVDARYNLAFALVNQGKIPDAIEQYREVLRLKPGWSDAMQKLAWLLATSPDAPMSDPRAAVELAEQACQATNFTQAPLLDTLAAAYARAGRFQDAAEMAQKAVALAQAAGQTQAVTVIETRLKLYREGRAFVTGPPISSH